MKDQEPVVLAGIITTTVATILAILNYLEVDQTLVAVISTALAGYSAAAIAWVRSKVTPVGV